MREKLWFLLESLVVKEKAFMLQSKCCFSFELKVHTIYYLTLFLREWDRYFDPRTIGYFSAKIKKFVLQALPYMSIFFRQILTGEIRLDLARKTRKNRKWSFGKKVLKNGKSMSVMVVVSLR